MNRESKLLRRKLRGALLVSVVDSLMIMATCLILRCWVPATIVVPVYLFVQAVAIYMYWCRTQDVMMIYGPRHY